jgi:hypothetical protein
MLWPPQLHRHGSNALGDFTKGLVLIAPGGDGLLVTGQHFKLAKGRTGQFVRVLDLNNKDSLVVFIYTK